VARAILRQEGMPMRVLLADDSDAVRRRVAAVVAEVPSARVVGEAADATAAIAGLAAHGPDVLVLDVMMPGGGGLAVMDAIAGWAARPTVIVFTNLVDDEVRAAFLARGADHFLDKSADVDRLAEVLRGLASRGAGS
jgi:DNA-binding NarL/FixJ family response regulator